jgi:hypothetical protein
MLAYLLDDEGVGLQHGEEAHQGGEQALVLPHRQNGTSCLAGRIRHTYLLLLSGIKGRIQNIFLQSVKFAINPLKNLLARVRTFFY